MKKTELYEKFDWIPFYKEFADKLLMYKKDRKTLIEIIKKVFVRNGLTIPTLGENGIFDDVDPFTVYGFFNKKITLQNRLNIISAFKEEFNMESNIPKFFYGVPILNNQRAAFYAFEGERKYSDINNLWELFETAIEFSDNCNNRNHITAFEKIFDIVESQKIIKWNITSGLFWIRPESFISLDSVNRDFLLYSFKYSDAIKLVSNLKTVPSGRAYLEIIDICYNSFLDIDALFNSIPNLSYYAYKCSRDIKTDVSENYNDLDNSDEYSIYSKTDFLNEVYISESEYNKLVLLLKNKKNIILCGAPGVGKTFAAKRLAYSLIGEKDDSRIKLVQFHQSYSYEDFAEGYRPLEDGGFILRDGVFKEFCEQAKKYPEKDYFFIIDEINRGNLSKIFGEMLMLIEADKRGNEYSVELVYSRDNFSVPKNVYLIGMMNTADRSLAMIDYALRRRFAFYRMVPAFDNDKFSEYYSSVSCSLFHKAIEAIKELNMVIIDDRSLGMGFEIGHSYFCKAPDEINEQLIRSIIEYEIIPTIEEYWFDNENKLEEERRKLEGILTGEEYETV